MARSEESIIYLDTHIVVWLYAGLLEKLTDAARKAINDGNLLISPMVRLELQYLFEIGRIKVKPDTIIKYLSKAINLKVSGYPLDQIVDEALNISWTRDVFDRLLTAEAKANSSGFISADENIKSNLKHTIW